MGHLMGGLPRLPGFHHLLDQPDLIGKGCTHLLATEDQPLGPARPYQLGETLGATGTGEQAYRCFR